MPGWGEWRGCLTGTGDTRITKADQGKAVLTNAINPNVREREREKREREEKKERGKERERERERERNFLEYIRPLLASKPRYSRLYIRLP